MDMIDSTPRPTRETTHAGPTGSVAPWWPAALLGLGAGLAWGVAARVWMRLVTTEAPGFSWVGTLAILGLAGVFGAGVGLWWSARGAEGRRRWRRLALLPGLLLFAGQGLPFLPAFIGGALARRGYPLLRPLAAVTVVGPAVALWWGVRFDEVTFLAAPARVQVAMLVGMPLLALAVAVAGHVALGPLSEPVPAPPQSDSPDRARSSLRRDSSLEAPAGPA
jgi:hypothetical protein